ncbi:MAG: hypothetical protein IJJ69_02445 [Oscillospiraceae bacterium]|nr:hypothetical protein [Oscillospiraceae bacterium]
MKNEKKNNAQMKSNQIPDLPEVPSISNIDTLELEDLADSFPFSEMLETEPEAVLDVPSFSGLDTLDMESAAKTIEDLEEDTSRKEILPEIPVFSSEEEQEETEDFPEIPSFSNPDDFPEEISDIAPEILSLAENVQDTEALPAIPSFSDENEKAQAKEKAKSELENLPEISAFFNFDSSKAQSVPVIEVPERPDEEFKGDLSEAELDILPQIPSVLDLSELDLLSMPVNAENNAPLLDEDADYLPEIPSVTDWEEQDDDKIPAIDEEPEEEILTPMTEEMLAEEEIVYVDEMPLSVKAKNGLLRVHIRSSRQLVQENDETFRNIPHIDEKTLEEIRRYKKAKENPEYPAVKPVSREVRQYLDEFLEELADLNITPSKQRALKLYLSASLPEKNRTKENCWNLWYKDLHVHALLDRYITGLIRNRQMSGLSETMLREDMPVSMDKKILSEILQEMRDSDRIHETRGEYYILKYPTVLEFLVENTEEKEQHIEVIRLRMQGKSLAEIAKTLNLSKEHVNRIQNKVLRLVQKLCLINSTSVYEERYRPLFERYNLSREIFTALTKEPAEVYQYLSMVSVAGSAKPEEMKYDFGVPDWIRAAWKKYQEEKQTDKKS